MQRQLADFRERERESAAKHEEAIVSLRNELQDARDQVNWKIEIDLLTDRPSSLHHSQKSQEMTQKHEITRKLAQHKQIKFSF